MCDTVCSIQSDRTLFAKNSDRPVDEVQLVEAHPRRAGGGQVHAQYLSLPDEGAASTLGARPDWLWGFEHGVNEHRVAIGNERLYTAADAGEAEPALIGMDLVRLALERARFAEEALDVVTALLAEHGQGGIADRHDDVAYYSSFLLADPRDAWVLETSGRDWAARPVERGAAISNRICLSTDWTRASPRIAPGDDWDRFRDPEAWLGIADVRLAVTEPAVTADDPPPTARDLASLLRDHGGPRWGAPGGTAPVTGLPAPDLEADGTGTTVCMHLRGYQCTTSSMIAELPADDREPLRAWVAMGSPCVSVFVPVFPPDAVPAAFADPATFRRFTTLRERVEGPVSTFDKAVTWDPDGCLSRLEQVRDALDPVEAALWDEADDLVSSGAVADPTRRAAFVDDAWSQLDAALGKLGA